MANYTPSIAKTIDTSSATWESQRSTSIAKTITPVNVNFYPISNVYYFMRGQDVDCLPSITYRFWTVSGIPATSDSAYSGSRCGVTPFTNIIVVGKIGS